MANYVVGDIQGCWTQLIKLLDLMNFQFGQDILWCVGDLVNRGPNSLEVINFLMHLEPKPIITLGNHDLYLLKRMICKDHARDLQFASLDTIDSILLSPDSSKIIDWLRKQYIMYYDPDFNLVMSHAGIYPKWSLAEALRYASELEEVLRGPNYRILCNQAYSDDPNCWDNNLTYYERLQFIINAFTRMRYITKDGHLDLKCNVSPKDAPQDLIPWYEYSYNTFIEQVIIFGHWSSLNGNCTRRNCYALDTGCVWGGYLTAMRLEDKAIFKL